MLQWPTDERGGASMKVRRGHSPDQEDGWHIVATRGSHRAIQAFTQGGRVTVGGKTPTTLRPHVEQYLEAGWPEGAALMRYAIVIEKSGR